MGYLVILMLLVLFVGGVALFHWGVELCLARWTARSRWLHLPGTILRVERMQSRIHSSGRTVRSRRRAHYRFFPWVRFTNPHGRAVDFRSELGDGGEVSKYRVGQAVTVLYDPAGTIAPLLDSRWAIWFGPLCMLFAAIVLMVMSLVTGYLFRDRIVDTTVLSLLARAIASYWRSTLSKYS